MKYQLKTFKIGITPADTLFFRNGTPFGMGEETWTDSGLLPNPSVLWGALFTQMLQTGLVSKTDVDALSIKQYFFCELNPNNSNGIPEALRMYFPTPLDIFKRGRNTYSEQHLMMEKERVVSSIDQGVSSLLLPNVESEKIDSLENTWIEANSLMNQYPLRSTRYTISRGDSFAVPSPKIGIGREAETMNVKEGHLYRIEMSELRREYLIGLEIEAPEHFQPSGLIRLGGEGKTASIRPIQFQNHQDVTSTSSTHFKLYIQSPAFFENGNGVQELSIIQGAELISASIGKPMFIGGFDMDTISPKPMRKAVPPGSVYYFKGTDISEFRNQLASLFDRTDTRKGFNTFRLIQC